MEDYPRTLMELERRFATDEACGEYLAQLRWPRYFSCPACGATKAWATRRGLRMCATCEQQVSVPDRQPRPPPISSSSLVPRLARHFARRRLPRAAVTVGEIIASCSGRIASFEFPRHMIVVDELPLTSSGDIPKTSCASRGAEDPGR